MKNVGPSVMAQVFPGSKPMVPGAATFLSRALRTKPKAQPKPKPKRRRAKPGGTATAKRRRQLMKRKARK